MTLTIQEELVTQRKKIAATATGGGVLAEIAEMRRKHEKEIAELQQELVHAIVERDTNWQTEIRNTQSERAIRIRNDERTVSRLRVKWGKVWDCVSEEIQYHPLCHRVKCCVM